MRLLKLAVLILAAASLYVPIAGASDPFPECLPCPEDPPAAAAR